MNYKKKAWFVTGNCITYGYKDKYGFHSDNKTFKVPKRLRIKVIFYDLKKALKGNDLILNGGDFMVCMDVGLAQTKVILASVDKPKSAFHYQTDSASSIDATVLECFRHLGITKLNNVNIRYKIMDSKGDKVTYNEKISN